MNGIASHAGRHGEDPLPPELAERAGLADDWPEEGDLLVGSADIDGQAASEAEHVAPLAGLAPAVCDAQLAAWIDAVIDRDERALSALYDATFPRVFGLVLRIVKDRALAEEVVEDAYFQVWRQAVRFDASRGNALAWLLAMARSRAIDALRREARFAHDELDACAEAVDDAAASGDELLDLARHSTRLHDALSRLSASQRQLVSLAFFRGLSHEEIAVHAALPLGTVKSQIRRGMQSLRQLMDPGATPPRPAAGRPSSTDRLSTLHGQ